MKAKIFTLLVSLISVMSLSAQSLRLSGRVMDAKSEPVAYANVALERLDSTFVTGSTTNEKGRFTVTVPQVGDYLLQVSFVGYSTQIIRLENLSRTLDLGDLVLQEDAVLLEGVTVTGSNVIQKLDRQIIMPSQRQVKASASGYDLLAHMQLPNLKVNAIQQTVSTIGGGSVQLRINDMVATAEQVIALRPNEVLRVEYIDSPGVRYGSSGAEAVINYVVKRAEAGVSGGVNLSNAVTTGFGNDNAYLRANYKLSEFALNYSMSYRDLEDRQSKGKQIFLTPDGERTRTLEPLKYPFSYTSQNIQFTYNLTKPDKYIFNASMQLNLLDSPHGDVGQRMIETGKPDVYNYTRASNSSTTPSLDLFYKLFLPHKQELTLNAVGTYIQSDYKRIYREYTETPDNPTSIFEYSTEGARYSFIGEGNYQKSFEQVALSAGAYYLQGYTSNRYLGSINETAEMHNSYLYAYAQAQGKWKKLNYSVGVGMNRQTFEDGGKGYTYYSFRPTVQASYPIFKDVTLRYDYVQGSSVPELANMNDIRQQMTEIEYRVGNPNLKPYKAYTHRLLLTWRNKRITAQMRGQYNFYQNPIMSQIDRVDNADGSYWFEYTTDNQKFYSQLNGQLYVTLNVVPDMLSINAYTGVNRFKSEGNNYLHRYTSWYAGGSVSFNYKNFSAYANIGSRYPTLSGETISYDAKNVSFESSYTWKSLRLGVAMLYPFMSEGWSSGDKLISKLVQKDMWVYIRDNGNMLQFTLSWNFNSGRRHKAGQKSLNNSDSETGIVQ